MALSNVVPGLNNDPDLRLEQEIFYMLRWFQSRPRAEIAGTYGTTQVSCGDMYSLKQGYIKPSILLLWGISRCKTDDSTLINPEILSQFYHNGPDQVRAWAQATTIKKGTRVIIPVQNGRLWDLIVIDPAVKESRYHRLSSGECEPQVQLQTAMTLISNAKVDPWWPENMTGFKMLLHNYFAEDQYLPTTAICHYILKFSHYQSEVRLPEVKRSILEIADNVLQLINSKLESYCICANTESIELMIACDNPFCKGKWFHLETCANLKSVPKGVWYCDACSIMR